MTRYSGTSDKGPSEKGTASNNGYISRYQTNGCSVFLPPNKEDNLSTKDKNSASKVSVVQRLHCICAIFIIFGHLGTACVTKINAGGKLPPKLNPSSVI